MAKYRVIVPAIWIDLDSGSMRDRKKTRDSVVTLTKKAAKIYLEREQIEEINPPQVSEND